MEQTVFHKLYIEGQSVWLNAIRGAMTASPILKDFIAFGLRGINSNISLLDIDLRSGSQYAADLEEFCQSYKTPFEIYDAITVKNCQTAADMFFPLYEITKGLDGYVSLDINPKFAHIRQALIQEGIRLFEKIRRPNVMFKIIATDEGLAAMEELLAYGINVHVTFIFSPAQYYKSAEHYRRGVQRFLEKGALGRTVSSVASIFPRRIDETVDALLEKTLTEKKQEEKRNSLKALKGKTGMSACAVMYRTFLDFFSSEEFADLQSKGAHVQRIAWDLTPLDINSSTDSTYVTNLIANNTISIMPDETFKDFLGTGEAQVALSGDITEAQGILNEGTAHGITLDDLYQTMVEENINAFDISFDSILQTLEAKKKTR